MTGSPERGSPDAVPGRGDVAELAKRILDEIEGVVIGKRDVLELILVGLLADGHLLIEDLPGVAKTVIARCFAAALGLEFNRIQFTPDLMPGDITGGSVLDPTSGRLEFRPGPIFANVVLGDEINRAPPKTQSALLEAMQERQVTNEGTTRPLPRPFLVIATQNPIEFEGTYPLPEAQLDRFALRLRVGYPSADDEWGVLQRRLARGHEEAEPAAITDRDGFLAMQAAVESVHVDETIGRYLVALAAATRQHPMTEIGASPRATLALMATSRASALLAGRDFVTPDDTKRVAAVVFGHRISVRLDHWVRGVRSDRIVADCLERVPVPGRHDDPPP